ncbi:uncharacterized protein LOC142340989 [Convolutriloba macropyga]|uniref:uncharacterized protein LOC142340989 n=1 Tax=Convolutriloba macropyga TaxID=536237 RepID=UPI003F5226AB
MVEAAKMADRDKLFDHNTYYGVDSGEDSQWGSPTGYYSGSSDFQSAFGTQSAFGETPSYPTQQTTETSHVGSNPPPPPGYEDPVIPRTVIQSQAPEKYKWLKWGGLVVIGIVVFILAWYLRSVQRSQSLW